MRKGATLAEILVAGGLLLVVLGLFVPIWTLAMKTWSRSQEMQSTQRDILALSYRLRRDYLASRPESLQVSQGGGITLLSFLSYEAVQGTHTVWTETGDVMWRKWVQYRYEKGSVRRREEALPSPTPDPPSLPPSWLPKGSHVLATHLTAFQVTGGLTLRVQISAQDGKSLTSTQVSVMPALYGMDALGY